MLPPHRRTPLRSALFAALLPAAFFLPSAAAPAQTPDRSHIDEVLNGLGDAPDGFDRVRFGVLPLGTINVLAREKNNPLKLEPAWNILQAGNERRIDLPRAEFQAGGKREQRYFIQLAGAGLDARAI